MTDRTPTPENQMNPVLSRLRQHPRTWSFSARLRLLLVVIAALQVGAAVLTFSSMYGTPVQQRIDGQLTAATKTTAAAVDEASLNAAARLRELTSDTTLQDAIVAGDQPGVEAALKRYASLHGVHMRITGPDEQRLGGTDFGDAPAVVREAPLRAGSTELGSIQVAVLLDREFLTWASDHAGVEVFAVSNGKVHDRGGVAGDAPDGGDLGVGPLRLRSDDTYALSTKVLDGELTVGAALPAKEVAAARAEGRSQFYVFIGCVVALMVGVAFALLRSLRSVLGAFAGHARRIGTGALEERLPIVGDDEVAALAGSFNDMAESLEARLDELVHAEARIRRQAELFGTLLTKVNDLGALLESVTRAAITTTAATRARVWYAREAGSFELYGVVALRPADAAPSAIELHALQQGELVARSSEETGPHWVVAPIVVHGAAIGMLTVVSDSEPFSADDLAALSRLATQTGLACDNVKLHEAMRMHAEQDALTGLANRRVLNERLDADLASSCATGDPLSVLLMDIDRFKSINDTHGHGVGDEALKAVAAVLADLPGSWQAARYGGEEFCVLMPSTSHVGGADLAEHIRASIERIIVPLDDGSDLRMTISIGVADTPMLVGEPRPQDLLEIADQALYRAKQNGRNRVELGRPDSLRAVA